MKKAYYSFLTPLLNFRYTEQMSLMTIIYNSDCISWFVVCVCLIPVVWNYVMCFILCYVIWINMWHFWTFLSVLVYYTLVTCFQSDCPMTKFWIYKMTEWRNEQCVCMQACICVHVHIYAHTCACMVVNVVVNACTSWQ